MMKRVLYIGLLSVCGLWASCVEKNVFNVLDKVEGYMDVYPDSALSLLEQIPHPEELRGKQRADYALLLTQARDKNYLDSLQSDSLIKWAVDYYKDGEDHVKAGKALFYRGKVLDLQGNDTLAMQAYLEAYNRLEGTDEYRTLAKVCGGIGLLNDNWKMYDAALEGYREAASYWRKSVDTLGLVYMYRNIAWVYEKKHEADSTCRYAQKAVALLKGDTLAPVYPSLLQLLGEHEMSRGNYPQAIACFQKAIRYERIPQMAYHYYFSLGDAYLKTGLLVQAGECFRKGLAAERPYTVAGAYHYLHLLEIEKGSYEKALFYKGKSDSLLNVVRNATVYEDLVTLQKKYESMNLLISNEQLRIEKYRQVILSISLFFIFSVFVIVGYLKAKKIYKKQYREHYAAFSKKHSEELKQVVERNEEIVRQYLSRIENLKEESSAKGLSVLVSLRERQLIVPNMSAAEQKAFFEYVNSSFDNFLLRLSEEYKLSNKALMLVALVKLGFSNEELVFVFDVEPSAIWKRKQRLKATFKLGKEESLELFLLHQPKNVH